MELRALGRTGVKVSELCLGAMTFGRAGETDEDTARVIVDRFLEAGGNFIDTADVYAAGVSEEMLGRILEGRRDGVVLATKCRFSMGEDPNLQGANRRHIAQAVDASLRRLRTDWIDLYQIHGWDPGPQIEETMSALDDCVRAGKVRYLGVSNYTAWQIAKSNAVADARGSEPFVAVQPQYSVAVRDVEREILPLCVADGLAVIPWSPLGGGLLTGKYRPGTEAPKDSRAANPTPASAMIRRRLENDRMLAAADAVGEVAREIGRSPAQVALNWCLHRAGVTAPIIGVRTPEQLQDNLGALGWQLDQAIVDRLDDASAIELGYPHDVHQMFGIRPKTWGA